MLQIPPLKPAKTAKMDSGVPLVHSSDYYMFLYKLLLFDVATSKRKSPPFFFKLSLSSTILLVGMYTNHTSKYESTTLLNKVVQQTLSGLVYYILYSNLY